MHSLDINGKVLRAVQSLYKSVECCVIYCFLSDNVLSCSSRTAIDELECRARSCFCLSLNKLFVVVVVVVKVNEYFTDWFPVRRGVKQDCSLFM